MDEKGKAHSGVGATAADYAGNGWLDIFRSNFSDERETLCRNNRDGEFEDATQTAGMNRDTNFVGWGCEFLNFDNDGWRDPLLVNGHVFPEVDRLNIDVRYRDRAILSRNTESSGHGIVERHSARGAAYGNFDNDGAVEVIVNNQNEVPTLWNQRSKPPGNWIVLKLTGTKSNRSAIGAPVRLVTGQHVQTHEVRSGGSYLSQNDFRLHFGIGKAAKVDRIEIDWPGGKHQVEHPLQVNRLIEVTGR